MDRKLHHEPAYDFETLRQKVDDWATHGAKRAVIEWSTGTGPVVFCYPGAERAFGFKATFAVETFNYNEVYADYIEHTLVPKVREVVQSRGMECTVLCVDLQPLQVQRQRRRQIERVQTAAGGHH
jgi:hypothetical protein